MTRKQLVFLLIMIPSCMLYSHGLHIQFGHQSPFLWIKAVYEGDLPLPFGKVTIHDPDGEEYQNGRCDRMGRFTFQPDRPGIWQVTVDDEMGHLESARIEISAKTVSESNAPISKGSSPFIRWLLGVTIILLLTESLYIWKKR